MKKFSIREAILFGWQTFKKRPWFYLGISFIGNLLFIGGELLDRYFPFESAWALIISLLAAVLAMMFGLGVTSMLIKTVRGLDVSLSDIIAPHIFKALIATLLLSFVVLIGIIFLIVPGVYLGLRYQFVTYYILDKNTGIIESFKQSWRDTKGQVWTVFKLIFSVGLIQVLGLLALGVGIFVADAVGMIAYAYSYLKLSEKS